jgi:hypothetical protein
MVHTIKNQAKGQAENGQMEHEQFTGKEIFFP